MLVGDEKHRKRVCTVIKWLSEGVVGVVIVPLSVGGSDQLVVDINIQSLGFGVED